MENINLGSHPPDEISELKHLIGAGLGTLATILFALQYLPQALLNYRRKVLFPFFKDFIFADPWCMSEESLAIQV